MLTDKPVVFNYREAMDKIEELKKAIRQLQSENAALTAEIEMLKIYVDIREGSSDKQKAPAAKEQCER